MPLRYRIDLANGVIWTSASGEVNDEDVFEYRRAQLTDPDFRPGLLELADVRGVESLNVTSEGISRLAGADATHSMDERTRRLAIVASSDHVYGMARMYQTMTALHRPEVAVFRDYAEACVWLGIPIPSEDPPHDS